MLKKETDYLIVGNDYTSFLLGLKLLKQGKEVTIISPKDRPPLVNHKLTIMEKLILEKWGRSHNIAPLKELDNYIYKFPLFFSFDNNDLYLANSPTINLRELVRKFPFFFENDPELITLWNNPIQTNRIEHAYMNLCHFITDNAITNISQLSKPLTDDNIIYRYFNAFFNFYKNTNNFHDALKIKLLISAFNVVFRNVLGKIEDENHLFYLFLNALGPKYSFDYDISHQDILNYFLANGGGHKESNIINQKYIKNLWQIQLDSFDGIIVAKELILKTDPSIENQEKLEAYQISWDASTTNHYERISLHKLDQGNDFPIFWSKIVADKLFLKIFTYKKKVPLNSSRIEQITDYFTSNLEKLYPSINLRNKKEEFLNESILIANNLPTKKTTDNDWPEVKTLLNIIE